MKKIKNILKERELKNLNLIKGGSKGTIDKDEVKKKERQ